jgi:8-oxo-dGTP pyrophosphatase MutT (NUDIX family)
MTFAEFTKYIPKILQQQLPGGAAHLKMAPAGRPVSLPEAEYEKLNPKKSAVMMLVYPRAGEARIVLIKRNTYPGIHSAQISFPGGKSEPEDKDFMATALRETFEEVGITQSEIEVVMPFSEIYIPPSNFLVYPFLGLMTDEPVFAPNPAEVSEIIEMPLKIFLDETTVAEMPMQTSYSQHIMVPAFIIDGNIVWGATAMILSELKETIKTAIK